MLINPEDAVRMLRDDWAGPGGAKMLSQELFAIFTDQGPAQMQGPATFSNPGTGAPVTIQVPSTVGSFPAIDFTGPQGQNLGNITIDNGVPTLSGGGTTTAVGGGSSAFGGTVLSGGPGTGPYVVQLRVGGLKVNATAVQLDSTQTIPAGTGVILVKESNGSYSMQPPIWL